MRSSPGTRRAFGGTAAILRRADVYALLKGLEDGSEIPLTHLLTAPVIVRRSSGHIAVPARRLLRRVEQHAGLGLLRPPQRRNS